MASSLPPLRRSPDARLRAVGGEDAELQQLALQREPASGEQRVGDVDVLAQSDGGARGGPCADRCREEGGGDRGVRGRCRLGLQRIQRVALHERTVQCGPHVGAADHVHHLAFSADGNEGPELAVLTRDGVGELVDAGAPALEDVVHGAGRRRSTHALALRGDLAPDGTLVGAGLAACGGAGASHRVLAAPQRGVGDLWRRVKRFGAATAIPTSGPLDRPAPLEVRGRWSPAGMQPPCYLGTGQVQAYMRQVPHLFEPQRSCRS
jgi:hypothetical protein